MSTVALGLGWEPTHIVGPESRGFIFGSMVALQMGIGFIPVRKPGKLPHEIERIEYSLEYGENVLEIHKDALSEDDRVVIVDDLYVLSFFRENCVYIMSAVLSWRFLK